MKILNFAASLLAASLLSCCRGKDAAITQHSLTRRSLQHLRSIGMKNEEVEDWTNEAIKANFREKDKSPDSDKADTDTGCRKTRKCGEGLRELVTFVIDDLDLNAKQMVAAQLDASKFVLFSGTFPVKEWEVKTLEMPLETVNEQCFSLRKPFEQKTTVCTGCLERRNRMMNAIGEAVLCKETGVEGELPAESGPEMFAEAVITAEEPAPSGINIHILDSPFGRPNVAINGMPIRKAEEEEMKQVVYDVQPRAIVPSISDIAPVFNDPEDPRTEINSHNQPKSADEQEAQYEADAENGYIRSEDERVPEYGYKATEMGLNKHKIN